MGDFDFHLVADQPPRAGDYLVPVNSPNCHVLTRRSGSQRVTLAGNGLDDFQRKKAKGFVGAAVEGFCVSVIEQSERADEATFYGQLGNAASRNRDLMNDPGHAITSFGNTPVAITSFGRGNHRRASASSSSRSWTVSAIEALVAKRRWASSR